MENNFTNKNFVEKIGETISAKGKEVADKAKELAEITGLKSRISTSEDVIRKSYMEIGKRYYELHGSEPEEEYAEQCGVIRNAQDGIEELEEQIRIIKGV